MKKFLKTLIALTLATAFLFTGCNTTDISSEDSSNTNDASSKTSSEIIDPASSVVSEDNSSDSISSAEASSEAVIEYNPIERDVVTLLDVEGDIEKCTNEEARLFADTEEALDYVFFFASWANHKNYQSTEELLQNGALGVCRWLVPELLNTRIEEMDEHGDFTLSKTEVSKYVYCYFGVELANPKKETIPTAVEGAPYDIHEIALVGVEGNVAKFKCVFNKGLYEEGPTPFKASFMSFEVMKSGEKIFLRLVSITNMTEEFKTAEEASLALN